MSRAEIKYQSYFILSQSRGRSTFGRLIFSSHPTSLPPSRFFLFRPLSLILFCFVVIFARLISYNLHMVLRVNSARARARTAIKYQSYRLISRSGRRTRSAPGCCAPRGAQVCSASRIWRVPAAWWHTSPILALFFIRVHVQNKSPYGGKDGSERGRKKRGLTSPLGLLTGS